MRKTDFDKYMRQLLNYLAKTIIKDFSWVMSMLVVFILLIGATPKSFAEILTFDERTFFSPGINHIPENYGGMKWIDVYVWMSTTGLGNAYNWHQHPGYVESIKGEPFKFNGAYFNTLSDSTIIVTGYLDDVLLYSKSYYIERNETIRMKRWLEFEFEDIDKLVFYNGNQFYIDNFTINERFKYVNDDVTFEPIESTYSYSKDENNCPSDYDGKFYFEASLTNMSGKKIYNFLVEVAELTNGNLLLSDNGLISVGEIFGVPMTDDYVKGSLLPEESIDVPFTVCCKRREPFRFLVDVLGVAKEIPEMP